MDRVTQKDDRRFRRAITAMAVMAVMGYIVAFVQADSGSMHYKQYAKAFAECFENVTEVGAQQADCNYVPAVRSHLKAHRQAFAIGEPFLNMALSLTLVILISPLIRKCVFKIVDLLPGEDNGGVPNSA